MSRVFEAIRQLRPSTGAAPDASSATLESFTLEAPSHNLENENKLLTAQSWTASAATVGGPAEIRERREGQRSDEATRRFLDLIHSIARDEQEHGF